MSGQEYKRFLRNREAPPHICEVCGLPYTGGKPCEKPKTNDAMVPFIQANYQSEKLYQREDIQEAINELTALHDMALQMVVPAAVRKQIRKVMDKFDEVIR